MTRASQSGFTLIETLAALMVVALVAAVAVRGVVWPGGMAVATTARLLVADLRLARARALADERAVTLRLDARRASWWVAGEEARGFDRDIAVRPDAALIRFAPDGSSSGGRITLTHRGRTVVVRVERLTGRVGLDDG